MEFRAIDPATGRALATWPRTPPAEADAIVQRAVVAQRAWAAREPGARAAPLQRAAELLRTRAPAFVLLMADEMGKPIAQGRAELETCALALEHYAQHAARYLAPERVIASDPRAYVRHEPLGVVLGVLSWTFPFWQIVRLVAPALAAGNACLVKPAPSTPGCALALGTVWRDAGLDPDLVATLLLPRDELAAWIADPRIRGVTLTGSVAAGRAVAEVAGRHLKPCILELGGSDPYVVLADADLEDAVDACVTSRFVNSGQGCIAAKRWIVVDAVRERFEALVQERLGTLRVGAPRDPATQVGPLARRDLAEQVHTQVEASVAAGARLVLGGMLPPGPAAWYPVTLLTGVGPGMPAYDDEVSGPVAAIVPATDDDDALRIANDSPFGLGAAVFTRDSGRGEAAALSIEAGTVAVNTYVRTDPRLPFGGTKASGLGRELGAEGIRALTWSRTVLVG